MPSNTLARRIGRVGLDALWVQWNALGLGRARLQGLLLDPEALVVATWTLGRADPRLFDAALACCAQLGKRWLDFQRLKNLASEQRADVQRVGAAWAARIGSREWRSLRGLVEPGGVPVSPLFLDLDGEALPTLPLAAGDRSFAAYGWSRGVADLSAPVRLPDLRRPGLERLFFRALAGVGVRAELLTMAATLSTFDLNGARARTHTSKRAVSEALRTLRETGLLVSDGGTGGRVRSNRSVLTRLLSDLVADEERPASMIDVGPVVLAMADAWHSSLHLTQLELDAARAQVIRSILALLRGSLAGRGPFKPLRGDSSASEIELLTEKLDAMALLLGSAAR